MDGALLQAKIYMGYAKSATRVGLPCAQYRPMSALTPVLSGTALQTIPASFNAQDMSYTKPNGYGKALWYCLADGTQLQPGDYLVRSGDSATFFVAGMQPDLPILVVECNRVVNLFRPEQQTGAGAVGYGGETLANETPLAAGYPASVLQGSKGDKSLINLPGDIRVPWWIVLLPNLPSGVYLRNDDVMTDDMGRRYKISSAEQTDLGWRISAAESET